MSDGNPARSVALSGEKIVDKLEFWSIVQIVALPDPHSPDSLPHTLLRMFASLNC